MSTDHQSVGTRAFAEAVAANIGTTSIIADEEPPGPQDAADLKAKMSNTTPGSRAKVGVDVFIETNESPDRVAERLHASCSSIALSHSKMVSNRGTQVWPEPEPCLHVWTTIAAASPSTNQSPGVTRRHRPARAGRVGLPVDACREARGARRSCLVHACSGPELIAIARLS